MIAITITMSTDLLSTLHFYIEKALKDVAGMKVLLLDQETTSILSTVYSQSQVLDQEVYLVERLDGGSRGDQLFHLKAVCILRPTRENVARLRIELKNPRFGEYHLFFTNKIDDMRLQDLAEGDYKDLVSGVTELFGDFVALDSHHFSIPLSRSHLVFQPSAWDFGAFSDAVSRLAEGLGSLALSLRRRFTIRYQRGSEISERLASALDHLTSVEERELFDFGNRGREGAPLLIIIDRRDDPVTPLLSQWTYQAMIHEILGLHINRVDLRAIADVKPEFAQVTLSAAQDPFFAANQYSNFGDVGMAAKELVERWGTSAQKTEFQTIEDMASFVEGLPEYTHQQALVYKHVTLMGELSAAVENRRLMEVSSVEQDLACCAPAIASHHTAVAALVDDPGILPQDKMRLVCLFALRYEKDGASATGALLARLASQGVDAVSLAALRIILKQCSAEKRIQDIFGDRTMGGRIAALAKQHLRGVENVYTQHVPPIVSLLESAVKCRMGDGDYPLASRESSGIIQSKPPKLVVVFIVGGTTYEESKAIAELNTMSAKNEGWQSGVKFILGGTGVQNSSAFLNDFSELALGERYHQRSGQ